MSTPILATKLYVPPPRPNRVLRPRLTERLSEGMHRKLTLISAPAGFGKTTLVTDWLAGGERSVAWLSLDEGDSDLARFLLYVISALQTIAPDVGVGVWGVLQFPQPPPAQWLLTNLLNDIATIPDKFVLVLDDYHVVDGTSIDQALSFLLEHQPPRMHLIVATREDPRLPLARLRARNDLTELRAADLRFTTAEVAAFLNEVVGLTLCEEDIAALEARTEGWIAGLQLAAISLQRRVDAPGFIRSFTGSHQFVTDYLIEEVLRQQPERIQTFLLRTSVLERLCGPLCDAVLQVSPGSGQATLDYLNRANLFVIPLDDERRWYRYHHLFADLLRQRLLQSAATSESRAECRSVQELHTRASQWYEDQGLNVDAFHHAVAARDVERTARLVEGKAFPLHFRGVVTALLDWLESLPTAALNERPSLWWRYASLLLVSGRTTGVDERLQAAESALQDAEADGADTRRLIGQIAAARATLALTRYDVETMLAQSRRALEYLPPGDLALRANAHWTMGYAIGLQGDRVAARRVLTEAVALSQASGVIFTTILATIGLGNIQEVDNQLYEAAQTYRDVLQMAGNQPLQIVYEAHLGLARVLYEWNDLDGAEEHGRHSLSLARQYEDVIDRFVVCEVFLARLKLAQGDLSGAATILAQANQVVRERDFVHRMVEVAAAQVVTLLRRGQVEEAAHLARAHPHPMSRARVSLSQGNSSAALAALAPWRRQVEEAGWEDERLRAMVLEAVAFAAHGDRDRAVDLLVDALALAESGGFVRTFIDEGPPMAQLLADAAARGRMSEYIGRLLAVCQSAGRVEVGESKGPSSRLSPASPVSPRTRPLVEPLTRREMEVLQLMAQGLSNAEIGEQLVLALDTVKGHNRSIFAKLQVQRRTEAVARARELGLV